MIHQDRQFANVLLLLLAAMLHSCSTQGPFEAHDLRMLPELVQADGTLRTIELDHTDAYRKGFIIPSATQTEDGRFHFSFSLTNHTDSATRFFYKLYYQNESYKFPETVEGNKGPVQHPFAHENFYGSWEEVDVGFVGTEVIEAGTTHMVHDSFRIVGDPRKEDRYASPPEPEDIHVPEDRIQRMEQNIRDTPEWYADIERKARASGRTVQAQLKRDAIYVLKENERQEARPQPWKRNPRVGEYSFMVVVTTARNIKENVIPQQLQFIDLPGDSLPFIHPYHYYLHGAGRELLDVQVLVSEQRLKVLARPPLGTGIHVSGHFFPEGTFDPSCFTPTCNDGPGTYRSAAFDQFTHSIGPHMTMRNVPMVADVHGGAYTRKDYEERSFDEDDLITITPVNTNCPCATVWSDPEHDRLVMINPGTREGEWRKENVGLIARNGLTYGRYRVKVKMPGLLNEHGVWNGLTNAIWLINQSQEEWNHRRPMPNGYLVKDGEERPSSLGYSEIDIEIVKAARHWPATSYPPGMKVPDGSSTDPMDIMVTATNWDMANTDVQRYIIGVDSIEFGGKYHEVHRWDRDYRALTTKYAAPDKELFGGGYYWFEIDWAPERIIWRLGSEPDRMRVFAYMDASITNIANNQMLLVFTQEFHHTDWWPGAPFDQDRIPFPSKDIRGEILEVVIE